MGSWCCSSRIEDFPQHAAGSFNRFILADMPPVEAIEFLLERMKRTKNNKEFFATMQQG